MHLRLKHFLSRLHFGFMCGNHGNELVMDGQDRQASPLSVLPQQQPVYQQLSCRALDSAVVAEKPVRYKRARTSLYTLRLLDPRLFHGDYYLQFPQGHAVMGHAPSYNGTSRPLAASSTLGTWWLRSRLPRALSLVV